MDTVTKNRKRNKDVGEVKIDGNLYRAEFYYLRSNYRSENEPFITCCFLFSELGEYSRGISICSRNEPFSKKEGRKKAKGKAVLAMRKKMIGAPIFREEAIGVITTCMRALNLRTGKFPSHKAEYKPAPFWPLEEKLIKKYYGVKEINEN